MNIQLWAAELTRPLRGEEEALLMKLLPPERRERLLRLKIEEKRWEPLCAYSLLRMTLRRQLGWREIPHIEKNSFGKPYFPEFTTVHFNISHTTGAVLVALHDEPVGVDIEKIRPVNERTRKRLVGVATEQSFYESWVRREARVKCTGNAIESMLKSETTLQDGERFYYVKTFPGYVAGISTRSESAVWRLQKLSLEELFKEL